MPFIDGVQIIKTTTKIYNFENLININGQRWRVMEEDGRQVELEEERRREEIKRQTYITDFK